jgi:hypothetical protein
VGGLLLCALAVGRLSAAPCALGRGVHGTLAAQVEHVYNQVATDADDRSGSYLAEIDAHSGAFSVTLQTNYSTYDSQHAGSNTMTTVHTIAGPTVSVPWFVAGDRASEVHAAACTRVLRIYAGIGYVQTQSSYGYPLGYGPLRGAGVGLDRFADPTRSLDAFGSLYYYPAAAGPYGPASVSYAVVSFNGGVRWRIRGSVGLVFGLNEEMRTLRPGSRAGFMIRDGPYFGVNF